MKQLVIGLFENGQANSSGRPNWRHPLDRRAHEFDRQQYWLDLARMCEDAGLHFLFLADAWGWAEINGSRPAVALTEGLDLPRLDPFIIAAAIVAHTRELGIVLTGSTLLEQPYSFARRVATLDELSGGRIGWNIVTTGTAATAVKAFGIPMVGHDERYRMADDFVELTYKLWEGGWAPDALVRDKSGIYVDPNKVFRIHHDGPYFRCDGYSNTARSPQGTPVLFQAGTSPVGIDFAGRNAEFVFVGDRPVDQLLLHGKAIRSAAVKSGRRAGSVKVVPEIRCIVGRTHAEAERKFEEVVELQSSEATVASYAMYTGIDLSAHDPATPMTSLRTELSQSQVARFAGKTVGDVLMKWRQHGVGGTPVVGTGEEVAQRMMTIAEQAAVDGFLISPTVQPGSTEDFIEFVLPILRDRGAVAPNVGHTFRERATGEPGGQLPADHPAARFRPEPSRDLGVG